MPAPPGPIRRAWYEWKMLRFPWRKRWLVGFDLEGNTFWEFKDALHALRNRRIAKYHRSTHYGDVNVSPAWMQWLRHTRPDPPTIAEQQQDLRRRETIKLLAARADQRWAEKPSALDAPDKQQPIQVLESRDPKAGLVQSNVQLANDKTKATETAVPLPRPSEQPPAPQQQTVPPTQADTAQAHNKLPAAPARPQPKKQKARKDPKDSPWNKTSQGVNPGDDWQPKGWTPAPAARRRS